jgi:hypothetical protein
MSDLTGNMEDGSPRMRSKEERVGRAASFMMEFAERTGLGSDRPNRRYLWTDAFAVCNFLGLARATGERHYMDLALVLVDQVHHVLGVIGPTIPELGGSADSERRKARLIPLEEGCELARSCRSGGPVSRSTLSSNGTATGSIFTTSRNGCTRSMPYPARRATLDSTSGRRSSPEPPMSRS